MLDLHSMTFAPFDAAELHAVRAVSRIDRSFDGLVRSVVRVQFLRSVLGTTLGRRAEDGLALIETFLLFLLALHPASDAGQLRSKAVHFRCASGDADNSGSMLCAALEADCLRLGLMSEFQTLGDGPPLH